MDIATMPRQRSLEARLTDVWVEDSARGAWLPNWLARVLFGLLGEL